MQEGDKSNRPKFNSQELDVETGYYFYNARYYEAELGRFITADNVIDGEYSTQGWNRFSYVKNNPVRYKDPTGHKHVTDEKTQASLSSVGLNNNTGGNTYYEICEPDKVVPSCDKRWVKGDQAKRLYDYLEKNKSNAEGKPNKDVCAIIIAVNEAYKVSNDKAKESNSEYFGPTGVEIVDKHNKIVDWMKDSFIKAEYDTGHAKGMLRDGNYGHIARKTGSKKDKYRFNNIHFEYGSGENGKKIPKVHFDRYDSTKITETTQHNIYEYDDSPIYNPKEKINPQLNKVKKNVNEMKNEAKEYYNRTREYFK